MSDRVYFFVAVFVLSFIGISLATQAQNPARAGIGACAFSLLAAEGLTRLKKK